jgi:hypothetical protein
MSEAPSAGGCCCSWLLGPCLLAHALDLRNLLLPYPQWRLVQIDSSGPAIRLARRAVLRAPPVARSSQVSHQGTSVSDSWRSWATPPRGVEMHLLCAGLRLLPLPSSSSGLVTSLSSSRSPRPLCTRPWRCMWRRGQRTRALCRQRQAIASGCARGSRREGTRPCRMAPCGVNIRHLGRFPVRRLNQGHRCLRTLLPVGAPG